MIFDRLSFAFFHAQNEVKGGRMQEVVENITLEKLKPFPNHPFKIREDEAMMETVESIKSFGVLQPAIVRPTKDGEYEILSGHRRKRACELAGRKTMPVIVRDLSDDAAVIFMVDSNLQRENILPSERAAAYKMKLDAMKRQGMRTDLTSDQHGQKSVGKTSREMLAAENRDSATQIQRYIRLTELQPELMKMVDEKKIAFTPAVELSYLKPDEQRMLIDTIESEQSTPSLSQAQRMKKLSQSGELNDDVMLSIMTEIKKPEKNEIRLTSDILEKYFPKNYTPQKMQEVIIKLLESWQRKRQMNHER